MCLARFLVYTSAFFRFGPSPDTPWDFSPGSDGKESARNGNAGDHGFNPWVGKIPWRREGLPTPVFWPGEFHAQGSVPSCWARKESDRTQRLTLQIGLRKLNLTWFNSSSKLYILATPPPHPGLYADFSFFMA